jgi:hypothetical protein
MMGFTYDNVPEKSPVGICSDCKVSEATVTARKRELCPCVVLLFSRVNNS